MMRTALVTAALVSALASSSGCTVLGLVAGSMYDDPRPEPPRTPPPQQLRNLPPGSLYFAQRPPPPPREEPGMSNAAKGAIAGAVIDAVVIGLTYAVVSNWCDYAC